MHRALPIHLALIALFLTACATGTTPDAGLDGPTTTITLATADGGVTALGVPFVDGQPVVATVRVAIAALGVPDDVPIRFTFEDGGYTYDPDGDRTTVAFAFADTVTVTLPAGELYGFETRGDDADDLWIAYGETAASVDATTTGVTLELQTMIDEATFASAPTITTIARGATVDLMLGVTAPGGYAVPTEDYAVAYAVASDVGNVVAESKLGAQLVAGDLPGSDDFVVTATVTGWRDVGGVPTMASDVSVDFVVPFTVPTGLGFDAVAPVATIAAAPTGSVGSPVVVSGTASDDAALDRVQVYVGPVLVASSDVDEAVGSVAALELVSGAWSFGWTPTDVREYTLTAVAIDTVGNEHRASTVVDVGGGPAELPFVYGDGGAATVAAGESVVLTGTAFDGFNGGLTSFSVAVFGDWTNFVPFSSAGIQVADGTWTLPWTAPATAGVYLIQFMYGATQDYNANFTLTVE